MEKQILREIGKIYRALNSSSDYLMKSIALEKGQYQYLLRVKETPGINQQDLSLELLVDKTTTAKAINKLVSKGYILKKNDKTDKRNFNLFLTEKGKDACVFLDKEERFAVKKSLEKVDLSGQKTLLKELITIRENVAKLYAEIKDGDKEDYIKLINEEQL